MENSQPQRNFGIQPRETSEANPPEPTQEEAIQALMNHIAQQLHSGVPAANIKKELVDRGFEINTAGSLVDEVQAAMTAQSGGSNPAALVFGGVVLALGIGLFFGNITGAFPTFPMAGWLTIIAGTFIMGLGKK